MRPALALATFTLATLALAPSAFAGETPHAGPMDSRVRLIDYNPSEVVRIKGVFRSATQIVLGAGETITSVALGDTVSWEVAPADNMLFIKPRESAGATNLLVVTKRNETVRSYTFELSTRSGSIAEGTDAIFQLRFRYPDEERAALALREAQLRLAAALRTEASVVKSALDNAVVEGDRNLDYMLAGSSELQPSEVSDNGQFTVLRFPRNQAVPAIFTVSADGSETVVPYDVRGEFVVIHQVAKELRLRRGQALLCIWNNRVEPYGREVSSGTASPDIERVNESAGE